MDMQQRPADTKEVAKKEKSRGTHPPKSTHFCLDHLWLRAIRSSHPIVGLEMPTPLALVLSAARADCAQKKCQNFAKKKKKNEPPVSGFAQICFHAAHVDWVKSVKEED
jgi:hypothetical protein